ncbi:MAG: FtsX-like permease family protein [Patescibacteria group bacterium]|jgi:ABC-type antimicrobial peptide transport system permease subunit
MKLSYVNRINFKKLKKYKGKSMFLIIPVTFLMAMGLIVSSQANNIMSASKQTIFGTAAEAGRLIELTSAQVTGGTQSEQGNQSIRFMFGGDTNYTDSDVEKISGIKNVESAALTVPVPISRIETNDLFSGTSVSLNNLQTLNNQISAQYTDQNFSYTAGEPIPIILNANSFIKNYEDWGGQDEITVNIGGTRRGVNPEEIQNQAPFKFEAISYDKNSLIGKEITISFGGLDPLQTYEQEFTGTGVLFRKLTADQKQANETARQSAISQYWDYNAINTPLTYTFKIVGIVESESNRASYIPDAFANQLMNNYIQKQLDARTDTEIPADSLNSTFYGMTYDGLQLQSGGFGGIGGFRVMGGGQGGPEISASGSADSSSDKTGYTIPGLVIQTERQEGDTDAFQQRVFGSSATATGVNTDSTVFDQSVHSSDTIVIRINDIGNRSQVVKDLNSAGYAYQDLSNQEVFSQLQNTLHNVTRIVTVAFIILSAVIIVLTMGKFVSESRKEIGVFRALGATKGDIKKLFMSQAIMYTLIGYIGGAVIGLILVLIIAKPVQLWFDSFIINTVKETFAVVQKTNAGAFAHIDWEMFGVYTALLVIIAILVSIVPAIKASRISPVQAIKNE